VSWLGHLVRSIFTRGLYDWRRLWDVKKVHQPKVVVMNRAGEAHLLFTVSTYEEAIAKRDRIRSELEKMPIEAWCDRYVIPATFADPDDPWRKAPSG
jgi:hypothetical protein